MKFLIVMIHSFPGTSAGANHMKRLSAGLRRAGHEALIVAPRQPGETVSLDGEDRDGTRYASFAVPAQPKLAPFYQYWVRALRRGFKGKMPEVLGRSDWDVAIIEGNSWWAFDPVREICQRHNVLVAPYALEWFKPEFRRLLNLSVLDQWLQRAWTYRKSDALVAISRFWVDYARLLGKPSVLMGAKSGYPDDQLPEVVWQPHRGFRLIFVGTWLRRELPQTLIRGVELAAQRGVDVELVVLGAIGRTAEERPAIRRLEQSPAKGRIRLLGWVDDSVLQREMSAGDAFVLLRPDDRETRALFPTRLPEYLATGRPVILSDAGDLALYLQHRRSAYVLPAGDQPNALAEAIEWLAGNPEQARAIGLGGREALVESFSQEKLGRHVAEFFAQLRSERGSGGRLAKTVAGME
jgi:glycosyltransferase involved in cell wall biosynthesis